MRIRTVIVLLFVLLLCVSGFGMPTKTDSRSESSSARQPLRLKEFLQRQDTTNLELLIGQALTAKRTNPFGEELEIDPNGFSGPLGSTWGAGKGKSQGNWENSVWGQAYEGWQPGDGFPGGSGGPGGHASSPAAPAPEAVVLGAIGVSIVGWLRRRRILSG